MPFFAQFSLTKMLEYGIIMKFCPARPLPGRQICQVVIMHKNKVSFLGKLHNSKINTILNKILADLLFGALKWRVSLVSAPQALYIADVNILGCIVLRIEKEGKPKLALPIIFLLFVLLRHIFDKPVVFHHKLNKLFFHQSSYLYY